MAKLRQMNVVECVSFCTDVEPLLLLLTEQAPPRQRGKYHVSRRLIHSQSGGFPAEKHTSFVEGSSVLDPCCNGLQMLYNSNMQFSTFKITKIKTMSALKYHARHNNRLDTPDVANPDLNQLNHHALDALTMHSDLINSIRKERLDAGAKKLMSNTVPAVELLLGLSRDTMLKMTHEERLSLHQASVEWAKSYYKGRGTLIQADFHEDETNPHSHLIFIPNTTKLDKKTGKMLPTLSAKDFYGNISDVLKARKSHCAFLNARKGLEHLSPGGIEENPNYKRSDEYIESIDNYRRATKNALDENKDLLKQLEFYKTMPIEQLYQWFESITLDMTALGRAKYSKMLAQAQKMAKNNDKDGLLLVVKRRLAIQTTQNDA